MRSGIWGLVIVLVIAAAVTSSCVWLRQPDQPAPPKPPAVLNATRAINVNHLIQAGDLRAVDPGRKAEADRLVGRYSTRTLRAGETFDLHPSSTAERPTLVADDQQMLIGVRVAPDKLKRGEVNAGHHVKACVGAAALPGPYHVAAVTCTAGGACAGFVRLARGDPEAARILVAAGPEAQLTGTDCGPSPAS